ncbi:MAG: AAA family ATPase [Oliverpabstia sp.]
MLGIRIENLFGHFTYDFQLANGRITILTGPNGFGKTTIIKCLQAIGDSDLRFFLELYFDKFEVYTEEERIVIEKQGENLIVNGYEIEGKYVSLWTKGINLNSRLEGYQERKSDILNEYSHILYQMRALLGEVKLIQEQRLLKESPYVRTVRSIDDNREYQNRMVNIVEEVPVGLRKTIMKTGSEYSKVANELDSTFPERLFHQISGITEMEFHEKMKQMRIKVTKLIQNGISIGKILEDIAFRQEDARALKVYFDDFDKKYDTYSKMIEQLELFRDIVNRRFRFKHMEISVENGFRIIDEESGTPIRLSTLSSGEKEIIVLFYKLLFEIPDKVFLLIDEPEISLHIAWQRMFAEDMKKIAELKELTVLVATHSPQIINGNRDIQVDLGELYKNGFNKGK